MDDLGETWYFFMFNISNLNVLVYNELFNLIFLIWWEIPLWCCDMFNLYFLVIIFIVVLLKVVWWFCCNRKVTVCMKSIFLFYKYMLLFIEINKTYILTVCRCVNVLLSQKIQEWIRQTNKDYYYRLFFIKWIKQIHDK